MRNATKVNADMVRSTFKTPGARKGEKLLLEFMNNKSDRQAAYLLRHHSESAITSPETYSRDQIDQLLSYHSMLFIAIYAGAVDPMEIANELRQVKALVNYPPLDKYFSKTYPLRILQLFSYFLEANLEALDRSDRSRSERDLRLFFAFFDLTTTFELDSDIEWFLWIIDGGTRRGWNRDRLFETLKSPTLGASILFDESLNSGQRICRGLLKFVNLCNELVQLTDERPDRLSLRDLFLGYYEYWYRAARYSRSNGVTGVERILELLDSQGSDVRVYLDAFRTFENRIAALPVSSSPFERAAKEELE